MPDNDAAKQKAARRAARRISRGTPAWDKDRTRKLFAQYQETHDSEVRDQLIVISAIRAGLSGFLVACKSCLQK